MPLWIAHWFWHGLRGGILAGGGAASGVVGAAKRMPVDWEWAIIVIAALIGFVNGADSYRTEPS